MSTNAQAGTTWDRTRWDRLQASLLCASIAALSGAPMWLLLCLSIQVHP